MKELIKHISSQLQAAYPADEANTLAWWVVEETTGLSRSQILTGCKGTTNFSNLQILEPIIARLLHFEPIQYIFGHTLWCGLDLKVTPATLIPRPETAELVENISNFLSQGNDYFKFQNLKSPVRVLDIGTGSGCIALALKQRHPDWQVTGIDFSPETIQVAKENAIRNNIDVAFYVTDIFSDFNGCFDIVVSNPPYICESEKSSMRPNVLNYEPATALFVPDSDPLLFYRRIAELHLGKYLFFEINEAFPQQMISLLKALNYTDIQITDDIYGKPRIIQARSTR